MAEAVAKEAAGVAQELGVEEETGNPAAAAAGGALSPEPGTLARAAPGGNRDVKVDTIMERTSHES